MSTDAEARRFSILIEDLWKELVAVRQQLEAIEGELAALRKTPESKSGEPFRPLNWNT